MKEQQSSYRQIMKATSLFGGVQIFQIVIQIIRSKFIAILLGPAGMGIAGLLNSTLLVISSISNFGLGTSAVQNIAAANNAGNQAKVATISNVLNRLVWITGTVGSIITLLFSPWLSQFTFGSRDFTLAFVWISITLLFNQLASGQMVILQGMRKLEYLAKANIVGSGLGLFLTIPLYYIWGIKGIVPGIILVSIIILLSTWYFSRKVKIESIKVSREQTIEEGKNLLYMGFLISLSGLASLGASYLVRIYISHTGGIEEVGLYNAGFAIINTYVGMVFTAMATDYFPRLSAVAHSNQQSKLIINQQAEVALLILAPILITFLIFIKWVVIILYSEQFIAVTEMIYWAAMGMFFKAASWSIAFIIIAKGKSRLFLITELLSNIFILALNILGYKLMGLMGLGISFMLGYFLYLILVFTLCKFKFDFAFDNTFLRIFIIQFSVALICFFSVLFMDKLWYYLIGIISIVISSLYSFYELDKRIDVKSIFANLKNKSFTK